MPRRAVSVSIAAALVVVGLTAALPGRLAAAGGGAPSDEPLAAAVAASAAPGGSWQPGPERYGHKVEYDVPVRMSDGVVLRADVDYPTDPATGSAAAGPFPVLVTMTPYGKNTGESAGLGTNPYFVTRGYIDVVVDVRGTGASGGRFTLFDPKQTSDGVALVDWAARLPHSTGRVGLHGASYLGIDQLLTAGAVGPHSPLRAIFPIVSANDIYRDTAFMGGIPDGSFDMSYLGGLLPATNLLSPLATAAADPKSVLGDVSNVFAHLGGALNYNALFLAQAYFGGANSYDNAYWHARRPADVLSRIVANGIPAYLIGGEFDLFQRGEPLNYAALQNAWAGRPTAAPMLPGQRTTGRYQLLDGPYTHLEGGGVGSNFEQLQLEWFDTWLKGAATGMADTPTPLHYFDLGTGSYRESATYPITGARPTTYYFGPGRTGSAQSSNDGSLTTTAPTTAAGADTVAWAPVGTSICDRAQDQWVMGAVSLLPHLAKITVPCVDDDRAAQLGPTALTYSTAPLPSAYTVAGPISATVYATANTRETEWVVNVEDVAPGGTSRPLTQGALLGSFRAVDAATSWQLPGGGYLMPYHDYTATSARAVLPGQVTRYDIEVFPTYATIAAGHRIRVTLSTTDAPHLLPTPQQTLALLGGVYRVQRTDSAPSSVTIPLLAP